MTQDKLFEQISAAEYTSIVSPKINGAYNLHNSLLDIACRSPNMNSVSANTTNGKMKTKDNLDFFISLSSAAGILGTRGQAVYAGTSTFLGSFSHYRNAQGLAASTIHLGAVAEVGYVAEKKERRDAIRSTYGDKGLTEAEFLAFLRAAMENQQGQPEIWTSLAIGSSAGTGANMPYWALDAKFSHLRRGAMDASSAQLHQTAGEKDSVPILQQLKSAPTLETLRAVIAEDLRQKLASLLMIEATDIDEAKPVVTWGLDSLVAVEMRNWVAREMACPIQLLDLMTAKNMEGLVGACVERGGWAGRFKVGDEDGKKDRGEGEMK